MMPNELIALVVTDWLRWKAVGQLDSAICSKDNRNRWLDLLKKECIFGFVNVGYDRNFDTSNNYRWCISRQIRTSEFFFSMESIVAFDQKAVKSWLQGTAPLFTTLQVTSSGGKPLFAALGACRNLRKFYAYNCSIENTLWETVLNNPNLEELHILEEINELNFVVLVPTNLPLFRIKKLMLGLTLTSNLDVVLLFQHLPALECLQLVGQSPNVSYYYNCLPDSCPKLAYLDLKLTDHSVDDSDCFFRLMKSLECGLRSLVLPIRPKLSTRELQSIAQYHFHSLRCLSIPSRIYPDEDSDAYNVADLINSLPHLHTLYMCLHNIESLGHKKITNPTIKHLMLDFWSNCTVNLCELEDHCPAVTTLSLFDLNRASSVVRNVINLLQLRPLIHTVCVDRYEILLQLREALPTITVRKSTAIDIFEQDC